MKILVLNCGSSSIKFELFDMPSENVLIKGIVEKVGLKGSFLTLKKNSGEKVKFEKEKLTHKQGIELVMELLVSSEHGVLKDLQEIQAVGHRVAHGGEDFKESALINDQVIKKLEALFELAPLHNPANLEGVYAIQALLPEVPQVAVFDTAFHQTMPAEAYMYAIPYELYTKYKIRRYGFHGTSHRFVYKRACDLLKCSPEGKRIISCHLGNGASLAAIHDGKSIDTSMGFTPVEGLMMGTRTGDFDIGALTYLMNKENLDADKASNLCNKSAGVLGVSGVSSDMREIEDAADNGNQQAQLAWNMFAYRVKKYIGAYAAALGGVDIIIFTGGIGENGPETREEICKGLEFMGLRINTERNKIRGGKEDVISTDDSTVKAVVISTAEELVIAQDTFTLAQKK